MVFARLYFQKPNLEKGLSFQAVTWNDNFLFLVKAASIFYFSCNLIYQVFHVGATQFNASFAQCVCDFTTSVFSTFRSKQDTCCCTDYGTAQESC